MTIALGEFELIERFFRRPVPGHPPPLLGIGDDAALIACPSDQVLAVTVDTLVAGVHFLADTDPFRLGYKALAVNLSDLAAMGAEPAWVTLALTLPTINEAWLEGFSRGFFSLAERYGISLIGGDTTRGSLSITLQAMGRVPESSALKRSGAAPGDLVYQSGVLGSAGLGLKMLLGTATPLDRETVRHQEQPEPRVELGVLLREQASACIDITDGLAADLGHILTASGVGAELVYEQLPLTEPVQHYVRCSGDWTFPLHCGDDYELCFTLPPHRQAELERRLAEHSIACSCLGRIVAADTPGLTITRNGQAMVLPRKGYDHFAHS